MRSTLRARGVGRRRTPRAPGAPRGSPRRGSAEQSPRRARWPSSKERSRNRSPMSPRLARLVTELEAARRRVHAIAERLDDTGWAARPSAAEWSVAECLSHLNLTSRAFVPLLRDALTNGRKGTARCRMDVIGALVWWATTLRVPVKTTEPFVPPSREPRPAVLAEFDTLQDQMLR